jgi:hypothetical protein
MMGSPITSGYPIRRAPRATARVGRVVHPDHNQVIDVYIPGRSLP